MEGLVMRMLEPDVRQAFVLLDKAVADDLDGRLVRASFEVWVED